MKTTMLTQSQLSRRLDRPMTQIQRAVKTNLVVPDQREVNLILFSEVRLPEIERTISEAFDKNKNEN